MAWKNRGKVFHGVENHGLDKPDTPKNRPFFALPLVAVFVLRNASRFLSR